MSSSGRQTWHSLVVPPAGNRRHSKPQQQQTANLATSPGHQRRRPQAQHHIASIMLPFRPGRVVSGHIIKLRWRQPTVDQKVPPIVKSTDHDGDISKFI
ncbi:hypothetical protein BgiBS90_023131 [Biomphalaria glabrata]|nr:hypothetical protein BgiBS90_023131 [Biomphalaria glabrata]